MEENFAFQKEDDRSLSHPNKPSLSAAHLRKQVLALGPVVPASYLIAIEGSFTGENEWMLLFVLGL